MPVPRPTSSTTRAFDPDQYRMTVGEHLEELRARLILALAGFAAVLVVFILPPVGTRVVSYFCRPLIDVLQARNLNPQLFYTGLADGFVVYVQIAVVSAVAVASPWIVYQFWRFVAAGLYPHERRTVTRLLPLSLGLLVAGMLFVYFLVLPWTVDFMLGFANDIPLPPVVAPAAPAALPAGVTLPLAPVLDADPVDPAAGNFWINHRESRLKIHVAPGDTRVIPFGPSNLLSPHITLPNYVWLVVGMLLTFGVSFQVPLVVMTVGRLGIVDVPTLRTSRRYVYFAMVVLAAMVTPGDVITATVALLVPLIGLYELGIWLARAGARPGRGGGDGGGHGDGYRTGPPAQPS